MSCPVSMGLEILKKNAFFSGQGEGEAWGAAFAVVACLHML